MPCVSPSVWALSCPPVCRAVPCPVWSSLRSVLMHPQMLRLSCPSSWLAPSSSSLGGRASHFPCRSMFHHHDACSGCQVHPLIQPRPYLTSVPTSQAFQLSAKPQE
ncbi:hypothetical protein LX36DRAFT_94571 [Colletotrichum falcatum]|nr:hypothetical protein LX36DRAFT_94571 [Colletotrichum falcatum]